MAKSKIEKSHNVIRGYDPCLCPLVDMIACYILRMLENTSLVHPGTNFMEESSI